MADPFPGHERYRGWLAIPYLDHRGAPVALRFRCLKEHDHSDPYGIHDDKGQAKGRHGKYMSLAGDTPRVFNVGALHRADDVVDVTEGEFDALLLEKLGLHAIAIPGANTWKPHHQRMLAGFNLVRVWADPDNAGEGLLGKITNALWQARPIRLAQDVTDTWKLGGEEAIMELIK